jgi:copper(I)-binding protein
MRFTKKVLFTAFSILLTALALGACRPAGPQIEIKEAWGRPSPMQAGTGAAYMVINNTGSEDDKLISAASDVAEAVEIHDMTMENDVMKMFRIDGIDIPAGGSATLQPGGKHVMFIGLYEKLEIGQVITVTLEFEKSGQQTIEVEIREP